PAPRRGARPGRRRATGPRPRTRVRRTRSVRRRPRTAHGYPSDGRGGTGPRHADVPDARFVVWLAEPDEAVPLVQPGDVLLGVQDDRLVPVRPEHRGDQTAGDAVPPVRWA